MKSNPETWFTVCIRLSIPVLIIGALFKIMHWPGANTLLVASMGILTAFSIARFAVQKNRAAIQYIRLFLNLSFAVYLTLGILHLPGKLIALIPLLISGLLWLWYDGFSLNIMHAENQLTSVKRVSNVLLIIGGIISVIGILFKIMHWPWAGILLVVGIALATLAFFAGVLKDE